MTSSDSRPVALITGAARRVGRAIALELGSAGHDIIVHFNGSRAEAEHTAERVRQDGARAVLVQGDLGDPRAPQHIIAEAAEKMGRIDVLVNNASVFEKMPLDSFDVERWHEVMQVNLASPIQLCQHVARIMSLQGGGCIVNFGDICTMRPWKNYLAYGPSKAGLDYVTRALARSLAPEIRVNAVSPGIAAFPDAYPQELRNELIARVPLKRAGTPEDMARAVRFLVESPYITGQIIQVDGGRSIA